jgi:hypothetical protein
VARPQLAKAVLLQLAKAALLQLAKVARQLAKAVRATKSPMQAWIPPTLLLTPKRRDSRRVIQAKKAGARLSIAPAFS